MGMTLSLGTKSRENLKGVHKDLVAVVEKAITITTQDFTVGEGMRTLERQKKLVASGASRTMNSRHLTGHAVDLHPYPYKGDHDMDGIPNSDDWDAYKPIYVAMKQAAADLGIKMVHGWDWGWDAPHHELPAKDYK
jgi:peptidoglycan L-alanyl-D-glutamate endopeptidase CwlK